MGEFKENISGFEDWERIYTSIEVFRPVIEEIINIHRLESGYEIENLTPGSNAVFKYGPYVIKIYSPPEAGDFQHQFQMECKCMMLADSLGINCPKLYYYGEIRNKYIFRYIVSQFVSGTEAGKIIDKFSFKEKAEFTAQIKSITQRLNKPFQQHGIKAGFEMDFIQMQRKNKRLELLSENLKKGLLTHVETVDMNHKVLVHGDMTGENLIITNEGSIVLIDFADCIEAPFCYELVTIIFDLFNSDKEYIKLFTQEQAKEAVINSLIDGLSIHEFNGYLIKMFCEKLNIDIRSIQSIEGLKKLFSDHLF